nr:hypothetical protein [Tanacetum cinerariifolium]
MVFKYRRGGGRGVKEKNQVSANDAAKVVGVYTTIEEPGLSLGGTMIKKGSENKGDKKKITTSVDDPAKDENGANKATNRLDQNVSPPVIDTFEAFCENTNCVSEGLGSSTVNEQAIQNSSTCFGLNTLDTSHGKQDVNLQKEDVGCVSVWVKFHGIPMTTFSEDGLSIVSTKLGTHLMLNSYTSDICMQSCGRLSYARAMINLRTDKELKDSIMVAMPKLVGRGFNMCTVKNKREKDKIETKPDQIKKKREAWLSQEKSRAVSVDRARKTEENTKRMVENART